MEDENKRCRDGYQERHRQPNSVPRISSANTKSIPVETQPRSGLDRRMSRIMRVICGVLSSVWLLGCTSERFHYLENAAVIENCRVGDERPAAVSRLLAGHYIGPGHGLILIARKFDPGSLLAVDDETYEKLTIGIDRHEVGVPMNVPQPGIRLFYSAGSAAFIRRAAGAFSTGASGTIVIVNKSDRQLTARLDLVILVRKPSDSPEAVPREVKIKEERTFKSLDIEKLTPWLGTCQPSFDKEVYP
jgi:hypothetical protein